MVKMALALISAYRWGISPVIGSLGIHCRFYPTCSQYAMEAFRAYGFRRGLVMSLRRLAKCHPYHPGGYDPV